ncbi:hypothetical protein E3N88_21068 [Mikania micrantha]|uniref:Uncharacterized protein n=1 Tax=Mikania micrantha TaxID=192012 RepID=A0A5N6NLB4_9ASTR|nr:hypothetical protein E3N88_21068 [Mikania micrantha]
MVESVSSKYATGLTLYRATGPSHNMLATCQIYWIIWDFPVFSLALATSKMTSLLKRTAISSLRAHHQVVEGLIFQSRRQIHVEPGAREKALLAKDPALERFKSYRKSASNIRKLGDYLTIVVVAGCCYEIYVRAVTREEARKALKSK